MSTAFDRNLLPGFDSVKDDDEEIFWIGKPSFIPYILSGFGMGIFPIAFGVLWILMSRSASYQESVGSNTWFWMFGLIPLLQGIYVFLSKLFSYPNTAYAYSNRRVMMRTGFIGTAFQTIDYKKISDIEVKVSVVERVFDVGTIRFFSGKIQTDEGSETKIYDKWISVKDPYRVFKMVKQTSVDTKTS